MQKAGVSRGNLCGVWGQGGFASHLDARGGGVRCDARHGQKEASTSAHPMGRAAALLRVHPGEAEHNAAFAYSAVLLAWLTEGEVAASQALFAARAVNPHLEAYLVGLRPLPTVVSGSYTMGSREEATCFAEVMVQAWRHHPRACVWLRAQA